jgi:hypothetical protein
MIFSCARTTSAANASKSNERGCACVRNKTHSHARSNTLTLLLIGGAVRCAKKNRRQCSPAGGAKTYGSSTKLTT